MSSRVPHGVQLADNIKEEVIAGVSQAAQIWNDGCDGQPANRFPTLIPQPDISMLQSVEVPIVYRDSLDPRPEACSDQPSQQCFSFAELSRDLNSGEVILEVFLAGGSTDRGFQYTLDVWDGRFRDLFAHEFGHIFGLDESPCAESLMNQQTATDGGGQVTDGDCLVLQDAHEPRNPLQSLIGGTDAACFLEGYCAGEPPGPWGTIRTSCGWVLRTQTVTVSVSVYDPILGLYEFIDLLERTIPQYTCVSWFPLAPPPAGGGLPDPPPIDLSVLDGPRITLALPRENQVVHEAFYLRGWVDSWLFGVDDVEVYLDGQRIVPSDLAWGFHSPELCAAGLDPGSCDVYRGLSATIDVSHLALGEHWLEVAAVDGRWPDPLASHFRRRFVVAEAPNGDPVAVDDEAWAVIELPAMIGRPLDIEVTANDWDPDGDAVGLTNQGVVRLPRYGTVQRISDQVIRYTPSYEALPDPLEGPLVDSLRYAIRDPDNLQDQGEVELPIIFVLVLP